MGVSSRKVSMGWIIEKQFAAVADMEKRGAVRSNEIFACQYLIWRTRRDHSL